MKKSSLSALVAAGLLVGGLSAGSASAADLGGNCCADLEERIAELEATTARKGNRKVSLTVSGWVGEQVMWSDDGSEQNVYVTGLGSTLASHFKFTGQATISPGYSAGYVIHVEVDDFELADDQPVLAAQYLCAGANGAFGIQLLQSYWFIKSDHLGKLGVGLQSSASDNAAILVDGSGSLVPANWVMFDYNDFQLRNGTRWRSDGPQLADSLVASAALVAVRAATASARRVTPSVTIRPRGAGSRSRPLGVKTTSGTSRPATRVSTMAFKLAVAAAYSQWTCDFGGSTAPFNGGLPRIRAARLGLGSDFGCGQVIFLSSAPDAVPAGRQGLEVLPARRLC